MITDVTSATSSTAASDAMKKSLGMNKDDFMKLFIAQLQYQDPMKPQDASAMLDQLSQLTMVEQSYNNTTALTNLLAAQNNSMSVNSVSFIGGNIKANGSSINFDGSSSPTLKYNLSAAAPNATVTISNAAGSVVRTVPLSNLSAGDGSYTWDGCNDSGTKLAAGAYTFAVNGGTGVTATTYTTGVVDGVSFVNNVPYLKIGAVNVPLTSVISVSTS